MYSKDNTSDKILGFIKQNNGITVKALVAHFGLNAAGIFRHLRRFQEKKLIYKIGKPPSVKYYGFINMESKFKVEENVFNWAVSGGAQYITQEIFCTSRDIFQARIDRLIRDLKVLVKNEGLVYLLVAVIGEIGNNSFDHNLGHWVDEPGVYFKLESNERKLILADRGQGVYATLKRVRPEIENDEQALKVAFTELISGRAPEKRGNGLKFVRKVIEENQLELRFFSGEAVCRISGIEIEIKKSDVQIPGTLAIIKF